MTDKPLTKKERKPELREIIEGAEFQRQLAKALPKQMSPERFVRITVTSLARNAKLLQCVPNTFYRCLLDLSAMGLEPDGRQAHLIPRRNKTGSYDCTLVIDYKGLKELLYRNGDIVDEHSDVVGDMDHFEYEFGSHKHLTHRPNVHGRGKVYAAYSYITLPRGGATFDVMSIDEIESVRKRSAAADAGPWVTDYAEMCKKTVFRRLSKSLPLSPLTRDALNVDQAYDLQEAGSPVVSKPAMVGFPLSKKAPEPELGTPETPESGDEATLEVPNAEPNSPLQPVSAEPEPAKPPGPLTQVRGLLKEAGFRPEELLTVLKSVRLVGAGIEDLGNVSPKALNEVLEDWQNCLDRLHAEREAKS